MPVHQLGRRSHTSGGLGLTNYWGYGTLGFFAPDARFAHTRATVIQVSEFQQPRQERCIAAGLEVILDVVYNHTPEGNVDGVDALASEASTTPSTTGTLPESASRGLRGLQRAAATALDLRRHPARSRAGARQPALLGVRDARRRLPLRPGARARRGRYPGIRRRPGPFFEAVSPRSTALPGQARSPSPGTWGPIRCKQGAFPTRAGASGTVATATAVRRFWRGDAGQRAELATAPVLDRDDLFPWNGRGPLASINFPTCHDGFTLQDLVSLRSSGTTRRTARRTAMATPTTRAATAGHRGSRATGSPSRWSLSASTPGAT